MGERRLMHKVVPASEVRNKLGRLLNAVHRNEERLIVEKLGIPVAAIISMKEYEHYRRLLAQQALREVGRKVGRAAKRQGLTEAELAKELGQTRREVFKETYGHLAR